MFRLFKYVKPYTGWILLAIVLLFAQANLNLMVPDYLSEIVDTGIQQGGIENAVPEAIRQSEMERLNIFTTPENQSLILGNYTLINNSSADYNKYLNDYPVLENESIYVLNDIKKVDLDVLNPIMAKPLLITYTIEKIMANSSQASEMGIDFGFNITALPPGTDLFVMLSHLPAEQLDQLKNEINQSFAALGDSMVIQAAIMKVSDEYQALGMNTDKIQTKYIIKIGLLMLLVTLGAAFCAISVSFIASRTAAGMAKDIRSDVFMKVESFSNTEFDKFSTSSLINRSTNDITQIQTVTMMVIRIAFYAPILGAGGVIRALNKSTTMWWIIGIAVLLLVIAIFIVFLVSLPRFKILQKLVDRVNLVARENLSGLMVVRAFNMQKFEETRFDKANKNLTKTTLFINRIMVIMMPFIMLVMNGLVIAIIWEGSHQVADSNMQIGDMMAFMQYAMQIVFSFLMMTMMLIVLPRASVSASRISEVLKTETVIKDLEYPQKFSESFNGSIEFNNVSFRYPGADDDVLHNINFTAYPGQTTAFIGATGAGKSTVVNLIPRFYDVSTGSILIDGKDIREVTQKDLRDKIGYVPQKSSLFSGTIKSNMLFADENADEETIQSAIEIAQATEFVASKEKGIDAEIAQGGTNVSGGQKQRLSIARALVKKPPIYILDDSVSALDFKTDAALRKALKKYTADSTLLMVTQRVSTIKNAEQIIVLDEGKIVGKGTHKD
ncbi:MAG: ABC transporter ATP-binding protein, partial [Promethearchaeota archaeon]